MLCQKLNYILVLAFGKKNCGNKPENLATATHPCGSGNLRQKSAGKNLPNGPLGFSQYDACCYACIKHENIMILQNRIELSYMLQHSLAITIAILILKCNPATQIIGNLLMQIAIHYWGTYPKYLYYLGTLSIYILVSYYRAKIKL